MKNDTKLNLGCDNFKFPGFINIDSNPEVNPDKLVDLNNLEKEFQPSSVDFIFAGHVFEHFVYEDSLSIMQQCYVLLKPHRCMVVVVPDYEKCCDLRIEEAERIILGGGAHFMLYNESRLREILKHCGFKIVSQITDLLDVPYLLVSNVFDPKPDPWQTAFIAMKI